MKTLKKTIRTKKSSRTKQCVKILAQHQKPTLSRRPEIFSILVVTGMIFTFSLFSVVHAQSLLTREAPKCEGFVACTQLFFGSIWATLTGNPISSSYAQFGGDVVSGTPEVFVPIPPPPSAPNPENQGATGVVTSTTDVKELTVEEIYDYQATPAGTTPQGPIRQNLILQPNGNGAVGIGGVPNEKYKLDVTDTRGIHAERYEGSFMTLSGTAQVGTLTSMGSISTPMLCLGSSSISCPTNVEDFGPWKKVSGGNDLYYDSGKVGIGTDKPTEKLEINGNVLIGTSVGDVAVDPRLVVGRTDGVLPGVVTATNYNNFMNTGMTDDKAIPIFTARGYGSLFSGYNIWNEKIFTVNSMGATRHDVSVGIGTNTAPNPQALLDLSSTTQGFLPPRMTTAQMKAISSPPEGLTVYNMDNDKHQYQVWNGSAWDAVGGGLWKKAGTTSDIYYTGGRVGIGTATPGAPLHVAGKDGFGIAIGGGGSGGNTIDAVKDSSGAQLFLNSLANNDVIMVPNGGNVGIGTASPGASLQISNTTKGMKSTCDSSLEDGRDISAIRFKDNPAGFTGTCGGDYAYIAYTSKGQTDRTVLKIVAGNDPRDDRRIEDDIALIPSGNVGIGFEDPEFKLDVLGDINVRSSAPAGSRTSLNRDRQIALARERIGFDVAELYDTEENVEIGDVLAVGKGERKLRKSSEPYETTVVGIVSGAPAILFEGSQLKMGTSEKGSDHARRPAVALAGKVPVKVSSENGPIRVGDYLTTSSTPGVAMKATKQGMTIGVALENYSGKGMGEVLTFLNIKEANTTNALEILLDRIQKIEKSLKKK